MRHICIAFSVVVWLGAGLAAHAQTQAGACDGRNVFVTYPQATQDRIRARADAVPFSHGLVWRADRGDEVVTLVGTMHVPDSRYDGLLDQLDPMLNDATQLLVEAGPKEEAQLLKAMRTDQDLMFLSDTTLPEMLPEDLWQSLRQAAQARGIPSVLLAKMRPGYAMIALSIPPCMVVAMQSGGVGVDKALMARAAQRQVPVHALEAYDTLFTLLDQVSDAEAVEMLRYTAQSMAGAEDDMATMADLYATGDIQMIWEFSRTRALQAGATPAEVERQMQLSEDVMLDARNAAWIDVIEGAAERGPVMVAAGALHMPGEGGVLSRLKARGWQITPLIAKLP